MRGMKQPANAMSQLYDRFRSQAESGPGQEKPVLTEYRVDELARAAGTTVRNVRAYQDRGLLPPPRRHGRAGLYSDLHLSRLRLIGNLLQRGYSLANIKEMITAWEQGNDLSQLLGLEQAITSPWSTETPGHCSAQELALLFEGNMDAQNLMKAIQLGLIQPEGDGFRVRQPRLLNAGAELVRLGIPLAQLLEILEALRGNVEHVAAELVRLAARLFDRYGEQVPPKEDVPQLANLIWRLRPLALVAVESEVQRAMEDAANKFLIERVSKLFHHSREAGKDDSGKNGGAGKYEEGKDAASDED